MKLINCFCLSLVAALFLLSGCTKEDQDVVDDLPGGIEERPDVSDDELEMLFLVGTWNCEVKYPNSHKTIGRMTFVFNDDCTFWEQEESRLDQYSYESQGTYLCHSHQLTIHIESERFPLAADSDWQASNESYTVDVKIVDQNTIYLMGAQGDSSYGYTMKREILN